MPDPAFTILSVDKLKLALEKDIASQTLRRNLQMEFLRRGLAEMPPPPPLQRSRRYIADLQNEVHRLRTLIYQLPRLETRLKAWVAVADYLPVYILIAQIKELRTFLTAAHNQYAYFPPFEEGQVEVATIYLVRALIADSYHKKLHTAIRQAIITPEHNFLRTYGENCAYRIMMAQSDEDPIPGYITRPAMPEEIPEYRFDLQLGVAMGLLGEFMEGIVPAYAPLCRAVRIGQTILRRNPLIIHYFKTCGWTTAPTLEAWYDYCPHARNLEEMRAILETTGLEIGPGR